MVSKTITTEDRLIILNTHSPLYAILLSGFVSGITLGALIIAALFLLSFFSKIDLAGAISAMLAWTLVLGIIGIPAAVFRRMEYVRERKFPYVYLFFGTILSVAGLWMTVSLALRGEQTKLYGGVSSGFVLVQQMSAGTWVLFIPTVIFCCFVFANPLKQSWQGFYAFYLKLISTTDYRTVYDRNFFYNQLDFAFYNARRYNVNFSVLAFEIVNFRELKKTCPKKHIANIQNSVFNTFRANIRETDVAGFLGEGEIFGIVIYCAQAEARLVADRILKITAAENYLIKGKKVDFALSYNAVQYSSELESPKAMIHKVLPNYNTSDMLLDSSVVKI